MQMEGAERREQIEEEREFTKEVERGRWTGGSGGVQSQGYEAW